MAAKIIRSDQLLELLEGLRAHGGDRADVEVKRAQGGLPKNLPATTCAFANMPEGGTIILGVDERTNFSITGVDNPADMEAAVASQTHKTVVPAPVIDIHTVTVSGVSVVIVHVNGLGAVDKPARYKGVAYLRQADGDYAIPEPELRMIEVAKLHASEEAMYDSRPVPLSSVDDLNPAVLKRFIPDIKSSIEQLSREDDESVLRLIKAITPDGELTLAGLYGLGTFPQGEYPALAVTAAVRHRTGEAARTSNLKTFHGSVSELLSQTMNWISRNITTRQVYRADGHMVDEPEIPLHAIREAVSNALIHRDLGPNTVELGKSIDVRLLPDRLTISSPGGLKALSTSQLESREFTRVEVNQRLYRIAKELVDDRGRRIIEGEGGGVRAMFAAMEDAGLPRPKITDTGVKVTVEFFRVDVPRRRATTPSNPASTWTEPTGTTSRQAQDPRPRSDQAQSGQLHYGMAKNSPAILAAARTLPREFTLRELAHQAGLKENQVRYALKPLLAAGAIIRHGGQGHRTTTYELAPEAQA
ncbi:hypothetical protein GC425_09335 [Corynebacterium sp. zg254]|uniref:Schlafen AlbA-2 domain-containing protein n=1 Tax=Corynebacterium zhongnanshanii TaxID=2768834 RepID=A0ABQ6VBQ8_9CORY|nr:MULTISPECIES: ATP-binding protein [Corynebacterium]KAB3519191.1 hypothetical protein F8377_09365 [Corynebacterium zhongnanshanii]MCR5915043.1 hypothetical protein [Corynebacterium sp. zg254]